MCASSCKLFAMRKVTDFNPIKMLVIILSTFLVSASLISPASAGNKPDVVPGNSDNPKCLTSSNASSIAKSAVAKN